MGNRQTEFHKLHRSSNNTEQGMTYLHVLGVVQEPWFGSQPFEQIAEEDTE